MKVAVVVESALHQRIVLNVLDKFGYEAEVVEGGGEALKLLDEKNIDVIVTNKQLPDMSGYELSRRIRAQQGSTYVPILMLGDDFTKAEAISAIEVGVNQLLLKPVHPEELKAKIEAIRDLRRWW